MKTLILFLAPVFLLAEVEEKQAIQKRTFAAARRIEVDNVFGSIHVTGYDGREIQLAAQEVIRADSPEKIEQARKEVKLDIKESSGALQVYVDGPFRCKCSDRSSVSLSGRSGYRVSYDFEIQAPRETALWLHTINNGEIRVEGVYGDYDLNNINGGIEFVDASGSGRVYALNGKVKILFRKNPTLDSVFGSLNGAVDLFFQPGFSANLRMKTFNGKFYTDFPLVALPGAAMTVERRDGRTVYKADRYTNARAGNGGPEIKLDGFNGDIRILKREN